MPLPTQANTPRPRAHGYGARINDLLVRLATAPGRELRIETTPLEAPRISTVESAEDIRQEFGALFGRSSFSGGEGLDFAHRRDLPDGSGSRYWDSRHIDVSPDRPGKAESISLLADTERIEAASDTNLALAYDGTALYMAEGTTVRRSTNFTAPTPTFADDDPHDGQAAVTVHDLTTIGDDVFAALGTSGIHKRDGTAGTWADLASAPQATKVWSAKGILLAATGTILASIATADGTPTTLVTLADGDTWEAVADAGQAILAAASDGYIYALGDDGSGGLELKAQTFIGSGVTPCAVAARHGFVFYATHIDTGSEKIARWWRATLTSANVLDDSTLIRTFGEVGDGVDRGACAMVSTNDAVWLGINESTASHIWRYDLATGGRSRWWDSGVTGVVHDALFVEGEPYWTVEGSGLYRRHPTLLEADGWLIGPLGDLFTASAKAWVGALLDTAAVSDGTVELHYSIDPAAILDPDHASWVRIRRVTSSTLPDTNETRIVNVEGRFIVGMLRLYANDAATAGPAARGFSFRAYPGATDLRVEMPVNCSDVVEAPNRRRFRSRGLGDRIWEALKGIEGTYVELELYQPPDLLRGVVEKVSSPIVSQPERGGATVVTFVTVRGKRVSLSGSSESVGPVGSFIVGSLPAGGARAA